MEPNELPSDEPRRALPPMSSKPWSRGLVVVLGVLVVTGSWKLGSRWTSDGPGSGYFPFYIGLILCIAGAGHRCSRRWSARAQNSEIFVDREQLRRVLSVLMPAVVYVLVRPAASACTSPRRSTSRCS